MKEETTYGLSPEQLARLLAIGLESDSRRRKPGARRTRAEVLRDMLKKKLSVDPAVPDSLPAVLNRSCDELLAAAGQRIGELLLDPKTDLAVIRALKDYGKELARRGDPEAEPAVATVIYYAAIASAAVFHQHKITRHSFVKLQEAWKDLEQKPWVPPQLRDLFEKARAAHQQRKPKSE